MGDDASASQALQAPSTFMAFAGVSLAQLTHVAAARAEGFALEEILSIEGLGHEDFQAADLACKETLCDAAKGQALFAAYELELTLAEERLSRRVRPLDDDLESWTKFLAAYAASKTPQVMLDELGLKMPDLARLGRMWKRRLAADRDLLRKAEKFAKAHDPKTKPPVVRVEPATLVPSPHANPKLQQPSRPVAPEPEPLKKVKVRVPPALTGTSLALDVPRANALPFVEADDEEPRPLIHVDRPAREALTGTSLSLDIPRGLSNPFGEAQPVQEKPVEAPAHIDLRATSHTLDIPRGPSLPFVETQPVQEKPVVKRAPSELVATTAALDIPRGPSLPFVEERSGQEKPVQEKTAVKRAPSELVATSHVLDIPRGPSLPFVQEKPVQEKPVVNRAPSELVATTAALEIPRGPSLPFVEAQPVQEKPVQEKPVVKRAPSNLEATLDFGVSLSAITSSIRASSPKEAPRQEPAVSAAAPLPKLSLEVHAALTLELVMAPERVAEVLARYQITLADRDALDRHYKAIVNADERQRAAWHAAYEAHHRRIGSMFGKR